LHFTPKSKTHHTASALPNGDKVTLVVRRVDGGKKIDVQPDAPDCGASGAGCKFSMRQYQLPITDGQLEFDWVWTNGHDDDNEGLTFLPSAQMRTIRAQVVLPPGVELAKARVTPPSVAAKCISGYRNVVCRGLTGTERTRPVTFLWDWNMWSRCRTPAAEVPASGPPAQTAAVNTSANPPAAPSQAASK
jgi:hypothetical protein